MKANMKLLATGLSLVIVPGLASLATSQTQADSSASAHQTAKATSSQKADLPTKGVDLKEGTKISANLTSAVDARTAKPGDEVTARVTKNIKEHGRTVIRKGDELMGRVTEVQAAGAGSAGSSIGIAFDRVIEGNSSSQLNAVLDSVVSTPSERRAEQQQMAEEPLSTPAVMGGGSASGGGRVATGGGLLGGAASSTGSVGAATSSTLGGATGAAGSTVNSGVAGTATTTGNLANTATGAVGAGSRVQGTATGGLIPTPRNAIHLGTEGQDKAQAGGQAGLSSLLSTRKGNLRLEQGTELQFRAAAAAGSN